MSLANDLRRLLTLRTHWRRPRAPVSNELPQSEREGRRITPVEGSRWQ